jgi:isopentenyl diphosphate isomerase/L-lactate dehydrogenase-like FMN-dependent dehydrogenase
MIRLADFEKAAKQVLPASSWNFYKYSAEENVTYNDNFAALKRYKLLPRLLVDVSVADTSTTVLGHHVSFPVCISPTACQGRAHADGEVGTAQGAEAADTIFTLSTWSNRTLEDVAQGAPNGLKFFNVYIFANKDLTRELVRRAETNGYKALMVTIDSPISKFNAKMVGSGADARLTEYKQSPYTFPNVVPPNLQNSHDQAEYILNLIDKTLTWKDIEWLRSVTSLPIILKGILRADDALKAVEVGAAGIFVSNHGGRNLDTTPATIEVLSEVVRAVDGRCEVYMDGGIRTGSDIVKALALGARAVFIGRPAIYALAYNGAAGVEEMLQILKMEFFAAMGMSGCARISDINSSLVRHQSEFPAKI